MALARHERFVYPTLEAPVAMPPYPAALLPERLAPVDVCVDVVVGADGDVGAVTEREDADCARAPDGLHAAFVEPTHDAIRAWRYMPALRCTAPLEYAGDDSCSADGVVETAVPVRLSYAIRFSQRDGTPQVERGD